MLLHIGGQNQLDCTAVGEVDAALCRVVLALKVQRPKEVSTASSTVRAMHSRTSDGGNCAIQPVALGVPIS